MRRPPRLRALLVLIYGLSLPLPPPSPPNPSPCLTPRPWRSTPAPKCPSRGVHRAAPEGAGPSPGRGPPTLRAQGPCLCALGGRHRHRRPASSPPPPPVPSAGSVAVAYNVSSGGSVRVARNHLFGVPPGRRGHARIPLFCVSHKAQSPKNRNITTQKTFQYS